MADRLLAQLISKNEAYRDLTIEILDEDISPAETANYAYELVPNFWVDGEKALEGIPSKKTIQAVLDHALAD